MPQTFTINKKIYSVDMLFLYLKDHHVPTVLFKVKDLLHELSAKSWSHGIRFGPFDVIENEEEFKDDYKRILKADLRYPILYWLEKKVIVDGLHRLSKAYFIRHDKYIKVRELNNDIMKFVEITKESNEGIAPSNKYEAKKLYKIRKNLTAR